MRISDWSSDVCSSDLAGFASLEEAADAISAYNPHRPRPKDLSGLAKNLRQHEAGRWHWHWDPAFVQGKFGSPDETRAPVVEPDRLARAVDRLEVPTLPVRGRSSDLLSEGRARERTAERRVGKEGVRKCRTRW